MNFKIAYFLLLILRAGLVESASTYDNFTTSSIIPDKCVDSEKCTSETPYCFVNEDDINCGPTENRGWRISPLDGLVLNNGPESNSNQCELFNPPEQQETVETLRKLLKDSEFGSEFRDRESAWFNVFDYLGNCPWKSQFCDKETLTCQNLFEIGKNCSSSNQCLSRYCEKYNEDAPEYERRCVEKSDTEESLKEKNRLSNEKVKMLLIIILISVGSSILILEMAICFVKARRRKTCHLNDNDSYDSIESIDPLIPSSPNYLNENATFNRSSIATKHLTSLRSSLISRISFHQSSKGKRDTSDRFSVLLPPPPTFNRDSFLFVNSHNNSNDNNYNNYYLDDASIINNSNRNSYDSFDSFDIYHPSKQFQYGNSFDITY